MHFLFSNTYSSEFKSRPRLLHQACNAENEREDDFSPMPNYTHSAIGEICGEREEFPGSVSSRWLHALRNSFRVPPAITHAMAPSSSPLKFVQATTLLRTASSVHLVRNEITKSYTRDHGDVEKDKALCMCVPL